jgi:hypothetical protein
MRVNRLLVALAVLLAGCRTPAPPPAESVVMTSVVGAVREHARLAGGDELRASRDGPLFVDVASFSARDTVPLPGDSRRTRLNVRASSEKDAIRCRPFGGGCQVRDNGLFVHLDSLKVSAPDAFSTVVTYTWSDTRRHSGMIGYVQLGLGFRNVEGEWRLVEKRVLEIT